MKRIKIGICLMIASLFILTQQWAHATSWVDLKPAEVLSRAEVIVSGTYDFREPKKKGKHIWTGYEFAVTHTYKGAVPDKIIAGIDGFDVGWADEFQQSGGEFLLFLEQEKSADFLTPVAGPNGMIQVRSGEVQHHDEQEKAFFSDYLAKTEPIKSSSGLSATDLDILLSAQDLKAKVFADVKDPNRLDVYADFPAADKSFERKLYVIRIINQVLRDHKSAESITLWENESAAKKNALHDKEVELGLAWEGLNHRVAFARHNQTETIISYAIGRDDFVDISFGMALHSK